MPQCVILAGGKGTRMWPMTESIPKALIPVHGKPFLHYQLEHLAEEGFTDVLLSIGYKGEMIHQFAGDGSRWNVRVDYVDEGSDLRGTGGALRLALDEGKLHDSFALLYGDSYLPISFRDVFDTFTARGLPACMTVLLNEGKWDSSNVLFDGRMVTRYQKNAPPEIKQQMRYIDYGFSALKASVIKDLVPSGVVLDLAEVFHRLSLDSKLLGYEVTTRFYEIGSPQGLKDLEEFL